MLTHADVCGRMLTYADAGGGQGRRTPRRIPGAHAARPAAGVAAATARAPQYSGGGTRACAPHGSACIDSLQTAPFIAGTI